MQLTRCSSSYEILRSSAIFVGEFCLCIVIVIVIIIIVNIIVIIIIIIVIIIIIIIIIIIVYAPSKIFRKLWIILRKQHIINLRPDKMSTVNP